MFLSFFYLLRERGLRVSLNEWLSLLEGMERGLHHSTLEGFYQLSRAVLLGSEADFDRFDQVFLEFFKDVPFKGELPPELLDWLNHPAEDLRRSLEELKALGLSDTRIEELLQRLEERLKQQDSQHNGGTFWVGTQGGSAFGNSGWHPGGLRIGGEGRFHTAMTVAGERRYRDFRRDNKLDPRQFQMAFRTLRQMTAQTDSPELELDVDKTIQATGEQGGLLSVQYRKPRKNAVKVLLLMDSGGSMDFYSGLCSMLFQAATKSNTFKELHCYYFHNCIYEELYTHPRMAREDAVATEWILKNFDSSYKVIMVGDAAMSAYELREKQFHWGEGTYYPAAIEWLETFKRQYPYLIWLNPEPMPKSRSYWTDTHWQIGHLLDMYELTAEGLEQGMKRLMTRK